MGRFLATLATLMIMVLGAAFVLPALINWNEYRPLIEKTASGILGRKVSILGDIDIAVLPEPHLRANNVAAGHGGKDGLLLTAESVDLVLSLQALLGGRLEAGRARLVRPVLTVDFAKPLSSPDPETEADALPFAAGVDTVEIDRGRLAVFSRSDGANEALLLTKINGALSAASPDAAYRFQGRVSRNDRPYDVKFTAAPGPGPAFKLSGTLLDASAKTTLQGDGLLKTLQEPTFEGSVVLNVPQQGGGGRFPVDVQLKSIARLSFKNAVLDDLTLTLDPQNRPQILLGSANIDFPAKTANVSLQGRSFDADGLLAANPVTGIPMAGSAPQEWDGLAPAADRLLWLYPDYGVVLNLEPGQVQLKGEPVEDVKVHGTRTGQRWVFDRIQATLPGESKVKLAGTVSGFRDGTQLSATAALEGKYFHRLGRWIAPSAFGSNRIAAGAFALNGSLTLSDEATALEGVTGSLDGTAFTGSLRYDKAPIRKLAVSLNGDRFDLTPFETNGGDPAASTSGDAKSFQKMGLQQVSSLLEAGSGGFQNVDAALSAGTVKTSAGEVKNFTLQFKASPDAIVVSKLGAEAAGGLSLHGEGVVPLKGAAQGHFEGRLDANTPQAILQLAGLAGYNAESPIGPRANALAPASLTFSYGVNIPAHAATAQLSGNLGSARLDGRLELGGLDDDGKMAALSAQLNLTSPDGNKLLSSIFPLAIVAPGASLSSGTLSMRLSGTAGQMQTVATLATGPLQVQLEGTAALSARTISFKGKAAASSQTPDQFLPPYVLALLGGEPRANLRIAAKLSADPNRVSLEDLSAETPRNLVTGRLSIIPAEVSQVTADLKAEQYALPLLFNYFLSEAPGDSSAVVLPAAAGAPPPPPDIWSGRPFSLMALQKTIGEISLSAKALKLSDAITLSDAQLHAKLEKGRLDLEALKGKTLGGDLETSFSLAVKSNTVVGEGELSLSGADLAAWAASGTPPLAAGQASLTLSAAGQGLSPRGLISVLRGRGSISVSDGQLAKFSPPGVQKSAEDLLAGQLPLTEETVTKKVLEAAQTGNFAFRRLRIPVTVQDGTLEIRRASFRGRDTTVRMEAYLDLNKMLVDSTWQMGVSSDRRVRWPPVKIMLSGPLRELGARPRTLAAEDFVRAVLVRKMEGDLSRLEGLNKPAASSQWTVTQEPVSKPDRRRKHEKDSSSSPSSDKGKASPPPASAEQAPSFEKRMRDALDKVGSSSAQH